MQLPSGIFVDHVVFLDIDCDLPSVFVIMKSGVMKYCSGFRIFQFLLC